MKTMRMMGDEDDGGETAHTGATDGRARKKEEIHGTVVNSDT